MLGMKIGNIEKASALKAHLNAVQKILLDVSRTHFYGKYAGRVVVVVMDNRDVEDHLLGDFIISQDETLIVMKARRDKLMAELSELGVEI